MSNTSPTTIAEAIALITGPGSITDHQTGCLGPADQIAVVTILAAYKAQQDAINEARQATRIAAEIADYARRDFAADRRMRRLIVEANEALAKIA
jgi:hypothetical protein